MNAKYSHKRPTIGVLAGWQFYRTATNLSYLAPIFRGVSRSAQNLGCNLLLGCGMGPSASPTDPLRPVWPVLAPDSDFVPIGLWNTDGLIVVVPLHSQVRSAYIQDLMAAGHPILFVGSGETGPTIAVNNRDGILEALGHLVAHGHHRIAFIAGTVADMPGDSGERLRAYQAGLEIYNLDQNPHLVAHGRHVYDGGYLAMQQIINSGSKFSAVVASNDESALGAMQALKDAGRRIPQDVAVIGFDNRLEGSVHEPGLSSIHVPLYDMGYQAVDLLLQAIQGTAVLPERLQVDTHLVIRESCGCVGGTGPGRSLWLSDGDHIYAQLVSAMASTILNEAHSLTEDEGLTLCQVLVDTFIQSVQGGDSSKFKAVLTDVLQRTAAGDDDPHIWQDAISLMSDVFGETSAHPPATALLARDVLSEARLTISAHMRRQHRQYVVDERWTSSRLSLLTARLLTALDELQIYDTLAEHLPDMDIHTALLGLFEAEGDDPLAWSTMRDIINPDRGLMRFRSQEFPSASLSDGEHPFILTLIPLVDQSGQIGFMVFDSEHFDLYGAIVQQVGGALNTARLYREATEGRRLAEAANRMKSRFLSTISHELRTPVNLIVGLSGMVLRDSDENDALLPDPTRKDVERIHAYSQHLGGLIGDVIDLATSDAGQLRLSNEYVDLGQALRIVAESGSQLAADKGLDFEADLPGTRLWVWGDPTRLRQVALNLINNAIKFTTSGMVCLRVEHDHQFVTVIVQDTGLGIPPEDQQAIFDEFQQSDRSIALGYGGLGLGLAISKRLVEMHGGSISVYSTGEEGAGSVFSFKLRLVEPLLEPAEAVEETPSLQPSVTVLTNNPDTSKRLCAHLNQRAFQVDVVMVEHGFDWQVQIDNWHSDAIVLDVSTDAAFGWDALKEIKSHPALTGTPVFFFSSSQFDGALLELDYLTKPIEISELTKALDQHWLLPDPHHPDRTVLVVDDEPSTLEMHARIVQSHSASNRVLKARTGQEALEILRREIVDLVLLDLQMPEMDGFEVLEIMRTMESVRSIPVIIVTGKVLTETDMSRLNEGVAAVLGKGLFSIEETISHISSALEHKRKLSEEARRLVRLAMGYIHQNFAEAISRGDIAGHVGISEDHLTFCFRQELGTTPITYLQRYRINQAKILLKGSQQTITEIALNVGFSDSSYFSRLFHRETGMSPETFRRS
jgi:signal transduction histidine kinase/DNA-binding LacI/PurR family transcriptional regulator/AraC-like DNA-binding protein/DNA-binding LytR/AlgR family response regulator